jgi:hypothetical protein
MKKLLLSFSLLVLGFSSNAQTWTEQATGYPIASTYTGDISIVDDNVAWALAQRTSTVNHQTFSKTSDAGQTWESGSIGVGNATGLGIGNITAVSATTAWVSVFPVSAALATQGVYKTIDGGATWTRQTTATFNTSSFTNFVYFWDANNGVCMGDKKGGYFEIYTTTNGGTNWTRTPSANIPATTTDYGYTGKFFVQGNTIWFGTDGGQLLKSVNKGLNWTLINTPVADFGGGTDTTSIAEFAFSDDNNGFILKETYDGATPNNYVSTTLYRTVNGGTTWTTVAAGPDMFHGAIAFAGPGMLITAGSSTGNFGSSYSTDNGLTWTEIDQLSHTSLSFSSATLGYGGGFSEDELIGGIFKFTNNLSNEQFTSTKFKVYPNPSSSVVTISSEGFDAYKLKVTDVTGKVIVTKEFTGAENTLDISSYNAGVYFFEINSNNKSETIKIIKN